MRSLCAAAMSTFVLLSTPSLLGAQDGGERPAPDARQHPRPRPRPRPRQTRITRALDWLKAHQDESGCWGARRYQRHCPEGDTCAGAGDDSADLRVTGLALLALLGDGSTLTSGPSADNVRRAFAWLGERTTQRGASAKDKPARELGSPTLGCDRAIAALALVEAVGLSLEATDENRAVARRAIEALLAEQAPQGGWSGRPGEPTCDPTTTAWAVMALQATQRFYKFHVDLPSSSLERALAWLRQIEEPRVERAMAGAIVLARLRLGDDPIKHPELKSLASAVVKEWPDDLAAVAAPPPRLLDVFAMHNMRGTVSPSWQGLYQALRTSQSADRHALGSWQPPAADPGGRVEATAAAVLCLQLFDPGSVRWMSLR